MTLTRVATNPLPARPLNAPAHAAVRGEVLQLSSAQLFRGASEVQIEHNGAVYRLKQTALGKLILTK